MINDSIRKWLLILVPLLLVKFALLPLLEWQNVKHDEVSLLSNQWHRTQLLLNDTEHFEDYYQQLHAQKKKVNGHFPQANPDEYRITLQQEMQQMLAANSVEMELFDWVMVEQRGQVFNRATLTVRVSGDVAAIVKAHAAVDSFANVQTNSVTLFWPERLQQGTKVTATFDFTVYFQEAHRGNS